MIVHVSMYIFIFMSGEFPTEDVAEFVAGYKRTVADERQEGRMTLQEGISALSFGLNRNICELAVRLVMFFIHNALVLYKISL